jgi:hypothetical protein
MRRRFADVFGEALCANLFQRLFGVALRLP